MFCFYCVVVLLSVKNVCGLGKCYPSNMPGIVSGKMLKNHNFHEKNGLSFISCLKLCTKFSLCSSINYLDSGTCQLNVKTSDAAPGDFVESKDSRYISKASIPTELAGACLHRSCKIDERCVVTKKIGHVCVKLEPQMLCGSPPTITEAITHRVPSSGIARYACKARNQKISPMAHCPVSKCLGVNNWTTPTVSCTETDCYVASAKVNCTDSGKPCMVWSQTNHAMYNNLGDNNYCSVRDHWGPWCIIDTDHHWENCYVFAC